MISIERVANRYLSAQVRTKTAGEVRFIKDRSNDAGEWGWGTPGPSEREIEEGFDFRPGYLKPIAQTLRSTLMALGHVTSAHGRFVKIKSRNVSPDGNLGGKGYIQKITDMRRQFMNCIESLSALSDTLYDEINAPHWDLSTESVGSREREEVEEILEDAEDIKEDPEGWAEEEESEMDEEYGKKAHTKAAFGRLVKVYVEGDRLTGLWGVYVRHGNRETNVTGDIFTSERAAEKESKIIQQQAEAGISVQNLSHGYSQYNRSASEGRVVDRYLNRSQP